MNYLPPHYDGVDDDRVADDDLGDRDLGEEPIGGADEALAASLDRLRNKNETKVTLAILQSYYTYVVANRAARDLRAFNLLYLVTLDDIEPLALRAAALEWLNGENKFMPSPGELRATAARIIDRASGATPIPDVAEAYAQAKRYVSAWRDYRELDSAPASWGYYEDDGGALVKKTFEESRLYPRGIHPASIDAARYVGFNRIFEEGEDRSTVAQFRDAYGIVAHRSDATRAISSPPVAALIADLANKLRAPTAPKSLPDPGNGRETSNGRALPEASR